MIRETWVHNEPSSLVI